MQLYCVWTVLIGHQEHILSVYQLPACLCVHSFLFVFSLGLHDSIAYPCQGVLFRRRSTLLSPPLQQPFHRHHLVCGHKLLGENLSRSVRGCNLEHLLRLCAVIVCDLGFQHGNKVGKLNILGLVLDRHLLVKAAVFYNVRLLIDTSVYAGFN